MHLGFVQCSDNITVRCACHDNSDTRPPTNCSVASRNASIVGNRHKTAPVLSLAHIACGS